MVVLKEKNFVLRPFKKGDEISLTKNANNKKIWINLLDKFPYPYTLKDAKKWIEIRNDIKENRELDVLKYFRWKSLKEKYGLVDKYNIE